MKSLETFDINEWDCELTTEVQDRAVKALEAGKVLYFPQLAFPLLHNELLFLSPKITDPKKKNISFDIRNNRLAGAVCNEDQETELKQMIQRYATMSRKFLEALIPNYAGHLMQAKTSFRPVEIEGRKTSPRKDDTLLHVDSFPSNPVKGHRILRFFANINQNGKPRVWRIGEPFEEVVQNFAPKTSSPFPFFSQFLKFLKITKDLRTPYDHYMLQIHDTMKCDGRYQKTVTHEEILFPSGSCWIVYTDQVSHAAMSGQHVLEQTFHLPVDGLKNPATSPLKVLEKYYQKTLV